MHDYFAKIENKKLCLKYMNIRFEFFLKQFSEFTFVSYTVKQKTKNKKKSPSFVEVNADNEISTGTEESSPKR